MKIEKMIFYYQNQPIYYTQNGSGKVLLLLHGFLESSAIWEDYIKILSTKYTIITIDFPGHGKTPFLKDINTMPLMANIVFRLLDILKISEVKIMGHSMGGYVALSFLEMYAEMVTTIILLNSTPEKDNQERIISRKRSLQLLQKNKDVYLKMAINNLFSPNSKEKYKTEIKQLIKESLSYKKNSIAAFVEGMMLRKDYTNLLKISNIKKFILAGEEDPLITHDNLLTLAIQTNTTFISLSGSHMGWLENKGELLNFLLLID